MNEHNALRPDLTDKRTSINKPTHASKPTPINKPAPATKIQDLYQREVDCIRAQQITKTMLDSGLISLSQFNKLSKLNRESFSPIYTVFLSKSS